MSRRIFFPAFSGLLFRSERKFFFWRNYRFGSKIDFVSSAEQNKSKQIYFLGTTFDDPRTFRNSLNLKGLVNLRTQFEDDLSEGKHILRIK